MMVKICGITNEDDALAAIAGGAAALGLNFCRSSPRYISPEDAERLLQALPAAVWKVGVFMHEPRERVSAVVQRLGLDVAQLHGEEPPESYPESVRVWKAIRVAAEIDMDRWNGSPAEALLLDGPAPGRTFNWALAAHGRKKIIIAGGLDAGNVRQAIATARPWGVDACSRIESSPGRKDHRKMSEFLKAALE